MTERTEPTASVTLPVSRRGEGHEGMPKEGTA
jgi:hypothetical protein